MRSTRFRELTLQAILDIHEVIVEKYGVPPGGNRGTIESLLQKIDCRDDDDIFERSATLLEGLTRLHPFIDGNKKTAIQATMQYLNYNGHILVLPLNTVGFIHNVSRTLENDPESNERLTSYIARWLEKNSIAMGARDGMALNAKMFSYYYLPYVLLQLSMKLRIKRLSNYILRKYISGTIDDINPEMLEFMLAIMAKEIKSLDGNRD